MPLIITHGWPGSIVEMLSGVDALSNPTAHGGNAEDAFDLVVPSMPGYGFSGKPTTPGWGPVHIARAWVVLMKRLGYEKFVAFNEVVRGNHFAAWQEPDLFTEEVRAGLRSLRR